jgi:DNA-binding XRE family transcriptional regulator
MGWELMVYQDKQFQSEVMFLQKIINAENVGVAVKTARLEKGLTQKDLAGNILSEKTVHRIEKGQVLPSLFTFFYILSRLELSADSFLSLLSDLFL